MNPGRPKMYSEEDIERMGRELIKCMQEKEVWQLTEFSERKDKCPSWVYELGRQYPSFSEYLTRAKKIIGRKLFLRAVEGGPDRWLLKTWLKRYLHTDDEPCIDWVKEDIRDEAIAKAEATKTVNQVEASEVSLEILDRLKDMPK